MKTLDPAELESILTRIMETSNDLLPELDFTAHDLELLGADPGVLDLPPLPDKPALPPAPRARPRASRASEKITIRIPGWIVDDFRKRAAETGSKYQTELKRTLRAAVLARRHV